MALIAMLTILTFKNPIKKIFFKPRKESFEHVWDLFKFELSIGCMGWADIAYLELLTLMIGGLAANEQAGYTTANTIYKLTYPLALGSSLPTLTYSGNAMGERDKFKAQRFIKAGLMLGFVCMGIVQIICFFCKDWAINTLATDSASASYAVLALTIQLSGLPIDTFQTVLGSGIKAIGKEGIGAIANFTADLLIALPLAYVMCYVFGWGVVGIAFGAISSVSCKTIFYSLIYSKVNWDTQVEIITKALRERKAIQEADDEMPTPESISD
jgi:Na+-driven multidrug efflux pump